MNIILLKLNINNNILKIVLCLRLIKKYINKNKIFILFD